MIQLIAITSKLIIGAVQMEGAILVVSATEDSTQTREQVQLARQVTNPGDGCFPQ
ncbi:MAG: hypothetical protein U0670_01740 [Anaerolineae bacterium]